MHFGGCEKKDTKWPFASYTQYTVWHKCCIYHISMVLECHGELQTRKNLLDPTWFNSISWIDVCFMNISESHQFVCRIFFRHEFSDSSCFISWQIPSGINANHNKSNHTFHCNFIQHPAHTLMFLFSRCRMQVNRRSSELVGI